MREDPRDFVIGQPADCKQLSVSGVEPVATGSKHAVIVVHGIGQQAKFETLASIAEALCVEEERQNKHGIKLKPTARSVTVEEGAGHLQRIELEVQGKGPTKTEVHIYEAYWAPFTEGRITLRDVIRFLFSAGIGGLRNCLAYKRWAFGRLQPYGIAAGTPVALILILLLVLALVIINSVLFMVGSAGMFSLGERATWPPKALLADLNVASSVVALFGVTFGIVLTLGLQAKNKGAKSFTTPESIAGWVHGAAAASAILIGAFVMPCLVARYRAEQASRFDKGLNTICRCGSLLPAAPRRDADGRVLSFYQSSTTTRIGRITTVGLLLTIALLALAFLVPYGSFLRVLRYVAMLASFAVLFAVAIAVFTRTAPTGLSRFAPYVPSSERYLLGWWLLVLLSGAVRLVLVEFAGDIAIYVTPSSLDKFNELRDRIKVEVCRVATAVYRAGDGNTAEYGCVTIVGHSLGSVLAYDFLNRLLREDAARGNHLAIASRTRRLITFGSPLDKIAFIFGLKHRNVAAHALAATNQPLLQENVDIRWTNIHARSDIISGPLDFYDPADTESDSPDRRVQNVRDPDAGIPLAAHVEYWTNRTLVNRVLGCIVDVELYPRPSTT